VNDICHIALLVAFALILDTPILKVRIGANGGSISLTMLPLFILAFKKGPFKGFIGTGIVYGMITCLTDGSPIYSYPFDYLLGYGAITAVGFIKPICGDEITKKTFIVATLLGVLAIFLRLLFSTISGILFYELKFIPSLAYNVVYILPSGGITIVLFLILLKPVNKIIRNK